MDYIHRKLMKKIHEPPIPGIISEKVIAKVMLIGFSPDFISISILFVKCYLQSGAPRFMLCPNFHLSFVF
jgi:hypothetical protein